MNEPIQPKLAAFVHFLISECTDPQRFGAIRLNKAVWFSDVMAYRMWGCPITDSSYVKRKRGPVPKTILATLQDLQIRGLVRVDEPEYEYDTRRFESLQPPQEDPFSDKEKDLGRYVLSVVLGHSATEVSEWSHDMIWSLAQEGEEIPLYATLADTPGPITQAAIDWGNSLDA